MRQALKQYRYVGSDEIRERALQGAPGSVVGSRQDLERVCEMHREPRTDTVVLTFVVDVQHRLRVAPRRSEHVGCADGEAVLTAGEIWLVHGSDGWEVSEVSNQSLGYCPEPESWPVLEQVLNTLQIVHPGDFTLKLTFRRCPDCGQKNVVKGGWTFCLMCNADLPETWNFQECPS